MVYIQSFKGFLAQNHNCLPGLRSFVGVGIGRAEVEAPVVMWGFVTTIVVLSLSGIVVFPVGVAVLVVLGVSVLVLVFSVVILGFTVVVGGAKINMRARIHHTAGNKSRWINATRETVLRQKWTLISHEPGVHIIGQLESLTEGWVKTWPQQ